LPWSSQGESKEDKTALLMALEGEMKVYTPACPQLAVRHTKSMGPFFDNALAIVGDPMNDDANGWCETKE
jgi:hypothetical protein